MIPSRVLTKLVTTLGSISAGAVLTLEGKTKTSKEGLESVDPLVSLLAETVSIHSHPDEEEVVRVRAYLCRLIRRYGTARRAIEALGNRRRRHRLVSVAKAHAWSQILGVSPALVGTTLRRHGPLRLTLTRWLNDRSSTFEKELDGYHVWLDAELPDFDDGGELLAEDEVEEAAEEPAQEAPEKEAAPVEIRDESEALSLVRRTILECKSMGDPHATFVHQSDAQRLAIEHLSRQEDAYERAVAAIARGDFDTADAFLPHLEKKVDQGRLDSLRGDRYYFESRFDEAEGYYRSAHRLLGDRMARVNLAMALLRCHKGKREDHAREAIDLLQDARQGEQERTPMWARTMSLVGSAWLQMPTGDRDANVRRAIECFEEALSAIERAHDPNWWAEAHLHLGSAWMALPSGKKLENIQRAITCFNRAGEVWSRELEPDRWATVQNNLGHSWERLPSGHRAVNLQRAIDYFNAAATVRDKERDPGSWATIQNNLGNAWVQLPNGDMRENIMHAIECHTAALQVWSTSDRRTEWAATQNNLGNAWALLPTDGEERSRNLRRAISCYRAALDVRTRAVSPVEWAATQNNLGSTLLMLPAGVGGKNVREAIECFEGALEVRQRQVFPLDWAKTKANLATAWAFLPEGDRCTHLRVSVQHYENALDLFTAEAYPHQHNHVASKLREVREELIKLGG